MPRIDDAVVELLLAERVIRSLGKLRAQLTYGERLRIGELLRDCADALDHGKADLPRLAKILELPISRVGEHKRAKDQQRNCHCDCQDPPLECHVTSPSHLEKTPAGATTPPTPPAEQLPNPTVSQVAVRPLGAKHRAPSRPARPRNIVAAN